MRLEYILIIVFILIPGIDATSKEITAISISVSDNNLQNNIVDVSANLQSNNAQPISGQILVFYINDRIFAVSEIVIVEKTNQENNMEQDIPSELLIVLAIITLGIVGSGILYYLNKVSKN